MVPRPTLSSPFSLGPGQISPEDQACSPGLPVSIYPFSWPLYPKELSHFVCSARSSENKKVDVFFSRPFLTKIFFPLFDLRYSLRPVKVTLPPPPSFVAVTSIDPGDCSNVLFHYQASLTPWSPLSPPQRSSDMVAHCFGSFVVFLC